MLTIKKAEAAQTAVESGTASLVRIEMLSQFNNALANGIPVQK